MTGGSPDHMEYMRSRRTYVRTDPVERLLDRVHVDENGCWIVDTLNRQGYGRGSIGRGKVLAHRLMFERFVRPLRDDEHVHHRCEVRACCNPEHLAALSPAAHKNEHRPSTCIHGHSDWLTKPNGQHYCRVCHRAEEQARRDRQKTQRADSDTRVCKECGKPLRGLSANAKFCGDPCRNRWHYSQRARST